MTDSGDVKYRVGRLKTPLEGNDAKNGVLFKVGDLGIPDKIQGQRGQNGPSTMFCFPDRASRSSDRKDSTPPNAILTVA